MNVLTFCISILKKRYKVKVLRCLLRTELLLADETIAGLMRAQGRMALARKSPELHLEKIIWLQCKQNEESPERQWPQTTVCKANM